MKQPSAPESANTLDLRQSTISKTTKPEKPRRFAVPDRKIMAGILTILVLVGGIIWLTPKLLSPFPLSVQFGNDYPLLYPKRLPAGYSVDKKSFKKTNKVVIFNINTPIGRNVAVSEETIPAGINLSAPHGSSGFAPPNSPQVSFSTSVGPAYLDLWGDKYVCSMVAPDTWILLNVTGFTSKQAQLVAQAFTK